MSPIADILGLLPSLTGLCADEALVLNDAAAVRYAEKAVEVCGSAVAGSFRSLGNGLMNFGQEFSKGAAAEFVVNAQERLTLAARKTIRLLVTALSLILTASHSCAGLGWTLAQCKQQYGDPVLNQQQIAGRMGYVFTGKDYVIAAFFLNGQVSRIIYICPNGSEFGWGSARALLGANAADAIWSDATKDQADKSYRVTGRKDGVESYYASLTDDGKMLVIWTKEDEESGKAIPNLNSTPLSSIRGSKEKSNGEKAGGEVTSVDTALPPEINNPDAKASAPSSSWSPPERHDSPEAAHRKLSKVRLRSSMHPRYVGVKTRLIALWHQSLQHEKARGGTVSSTSNRATRKRVAYAAETRH